MKRYLLATLLVTLVGLTSRAQCDSLTTRNALMALYNATDGPNWFNTDNWGSNEPFMNWYGVESYDFCVTNLQMYGNGLTGSLPAEMGDLTSLVSLGLDENQLTGSLPDWLGNFSDLETLSIKGNDFTGTIPDTLYQLSNLKYLSTRSNPNLTGDISPRIGELSNLTYLEFGYCNLTGDLPSEIGQLANVVTVRLAGNEFTGTIPDEIGDCDQVKELSLGGNNLVGPLPDAIAEMDSLVSFDVTQNPINNEIPESFSGCNRLEVFEARDCGLIGEIPGSLGQCSRLREFDVLGNNLTGSLPPELSNCPMYRFDVSDNPALGGAFPCAYFRWEAHKITLYGTQVCSPENLMFEVFRDRVSTAWWDSYFVGSGLTCQNEEECHYMNKVAGVVFEDEDENCIQGASEEGFANVVVQTSDGWYGISQPNGNYQLLTDSGNVTVSPLFNPAIEAMLTFNCPDEHTIYFDTLGIDSLENDFGVNGVQCPLLSIDVASNIRRRCFRSMTTVQYSNYGLADQSNVEVLVDMPDYVNVISASETYTVTPEGHLLFDIGDLAVNGNGTIYLIDSVSCVDSITGMTQCTKAWITPANDCLTAIDTAGGDWDRSSIVVDEAECVGDTIVQVVIINHGSGDMAIGSEYRIYENNALVYTASFQLDSGDSLILDIPANGQSIRVEADQHAEHPGNSNPRTSIEGCGQDGQGLFAKGFITPIAEDDFDYEISEQCLEIVASYDPNIKMVSPAGDGDAHYVPENTSLLSYQVHFQNTGSDTAFTVVLVDTLSEHINPATLAFGASSHPYTISLSGAVTPVVRITFDNILLVDSATNEPGSHGYVSFQASPYLNLPAHTQIENFVDIYFDYNQPVRTDTAFVELFDSVYVGTEIAIEACTTTPITASYTDAYCMGDSSEVVFSSYTSAVWTPNLNVNETGQGAYLSPIDTAVYTVVVQSDEACSDYEFELTLNVDDELVAPDFTTSSDLLELSFNSTSADADDVVWLLDGNIISTNPTDSITLTSGGNYELCLEGTNACFTDSVCRSVVIEALGLNGPIAREINMYPNPTSGQVTFDFGSEPLNNVEFLVYDLSMKLVKRVNIVSNVGISLDLPAATYIYVVKDGNDELLRDRLIVK